MKTILNNFGIGVGVTYLWGTGLSACYFNYAFARDHGFMAWLWFGEIVATLQGLLWPYYLVRHFLDG